MRRMNLISALVLMLSVTVFTGCDNVVVPTVVTGEVGNITETSCDVGGLVLNDGGSLVLNRGVCYGTEANPVITGDFVSNDYDLDTISCHISGLTPGTTYYVRACALNIAGAGYGESVKFTTLKSDDGGEEPVISPEGAINGLFSVSGTEKVYFSKGNLQYQATTNTWRFAENQWDYVGEDNENISESYDGWIDLFGWGTSSYNHGAVCYQPWSTSTNDGDYFPYGQYTYNLFDRTGKADWGYNAISNGGNTERTWRTPTYEEWEYVFDTRSTNSGIRYAHANVNGVNGVILLPDDWNASYYALNNTNGNGASFDSNTISASQWIALEQHGAVFLPAAGCHFVGFFELLIYVGAWGNYWSASNYLEWNTDVDMDFPEVFAYTLWFHNNRLNVDQARELHSALSVRLIRSAQ